MSRLSLPLALLLSLLLPSVAGCGFYFGGDDDDDDCLYPAGPEISLVELRNPTTGQCEAFGGGWGCDSTCGPCPASEGQTSIAQPSWGACYDNCSNLDETTCLDTNACRAGYMDTCPPAADCSLEGFIHFTGCWAVDQTGPVQGECTNLDAEQCSRHDDCRAIHENKGIDDPGGPCTNASCLGDFLACVGEPELEDPGTCWDTIYCREVGPNCPTGTTPGVSNGCYTGECIDLDDCETRASCDTLIEDQCINRPDCDALYEGVDCSCDANGCSCREWVFDNCADA